MHEIATYLVQILKSRSLPSFQVKNKENCSKHRQLLIYESIQRIWFNFSNFFHVPNWLNLSWSSCKSRERHPRRWTTTILTDMNSLSRLLGWSHDYAATANNWTWLTRSKGSYSKRLLELPLTGAVYCKSFFYNSEKVQICVTILLRIVNSRYHCNGNNCRIEIVNVPCTFNCNTV